MEVKAISLEATESGSWLTKVTDNAFVAHIKHNGRLVVLEVNAAGELVISMSLTSLIPVLLLRSNHQSA